jgi:predicted PolB exonuclease-like 3'-5' exonuclease
MKYTVSKDPLYNTFLMNYNQFKLRLVSLESDSNRRTLVFIELLSTIIWVYCVDKIDFIEGRIPKHLFLI